MICERERLTDKQQLVYEYVWQFRDQNGFCPTVREICRQFGYGSPNSAWGHMRALRRKGWLTWESGQSRTIRPTEAHSGK